MSFTLWSCLHGLGAAAGCVDDGAGNINCTNYDPSLSRSGDTQLTINFAPNSGLNGPLTLSDIGTLTVNNGSDSVAGGNLQSVTFTNIANGVFLNNGNINGSFTVAGPGNHFFLNYLVDNLPGGSFNGPIILQGDGNNTIINQATFNPQIQVQGTGLTVIQNVRGASGRESFLNGGINVTGSGRVYLTNGGRIQGTISLGAGDDVIVNRPDGIINATITQGAGNDSFYMQGGEVNSNISQGDGDDWFSLVDGRISGGITTDSGMDYLKWTGGLVNSIDMGSGDDRADLQSLTATQLRDIAIDGGLGNDVLYITNTSMSRPDRLRNWEEIHLVYGSQLVMGTDLTLGDVQTGTGTLSIDSSSSVLSGTGQFAIAPFNSAALATVINAGTIDLTNGSTATNNSLTIRGNYTGQNGLLLLHTELAGDGAPSDKLVIQSGSANGATRIGVTNAGGAGAQTTGDGILVVQALNGATTEPGAFTLSSRVAAGPYEYLLFRGSPGSTDSWYLRSALTPVTPPTPPAPPEPPPPTPPGPPAPPPPPEIPELPSQPPTVPVPPPPAPGVPAEPPAPPAESPSPSTPPTDVPPDLSAPGNTRPIPIYRPEVATYMAVPTAARALLQDAVGTFHERDGEQSWVSSQAAGASAWLRIFGGQYERRWGGDIAPDIDGDTFGLQFGLPIHDKDRRDGQSDRAGLSLGYVKLRGDVSGNILAQRDTAAGDIEVESYSLGGYWTHLWPQQAYVDWVALFSWLRTDTHSIADTNSDNDGWALSGSVEAGYPFAIDNHWSLEPQGQLIWHHVELDDFSDPYSHVHYRGSDAVTARAGFRFIGDFKDGETTYRPFLRANVWHDLDGKDKTDFNDTTLSVQRRGTAVQLGAGLSLALSESAQIYATADYLTQVDSERQREVQGRLGFRFAW